MLNRLLFYLKLLGFDPVTGIRNLKGIPFFIKDLNELKKQLRAENTFEITKFYLVLNERKASGGVASGHYFHQDLLVAKRIFNNQPTRHIDIGSRIDGFVAHVACFREIEVFDIRPIESKIRNIKFTQSDLMSDDFNIINYCDSVSSLHAVEHFGLGRYGDKIDADGHLKGLENIYKILMPGGKFYFSTPIGKQRIEFNAHRVFDVKYLLKIFKNKYKIDTFSYVDDKGDLHENQDLNNQQAIESNFGCRYGCGIFEMTKL